jgi:hypothetical protein
MKRTNALYALSLGFVLFLTGEVPRAEALDPAPIYPPTIDSTLTEQTKLAAHDGVLTARGDEFGVSVAISGNTAVVGARLHTGRLTESASAYVFVRSDDGEAWIRQAKLTAGRDEQQGALFGSSVASAGIRLWSGLPVTTIIMVRVVRARPMSFL